MEPLKYAVLPVDVTVSSKNKTSSKKPSQSYYDISFANKNTKFNYIILQNFYVASITIKQLIADSESKVNQDNAENWKTILPNHKLMENAHYEGDAQDWHIVGVDLFNDNFNYENLSILRVFMNAPSPSWLDFYLKNISVYSKKTQLIYKPEKKVKRTPFGAFKKMLKDNMKIIKKDQSSKGEKSIAEYDQTMSTTDEVRKIELPYRT
mmetsp:Transcript_18583/g.16461  ORF Transcript_18583/g.16461 Transcript_18583/m.16461 type:complete len:208 (+) Transcript_18583:19-642(+)